MGDFGGTHLQRSDKDFRGADKQFVYTENVLVFFVFVSSIFIGQIVVFNMLIAIMAETFTRHSDSLDENGKRQKLKLVSEYSALVKAMQRVCCFCCRKFGKTNLPGSKRLAKETQNKGFKHLFVVTPRVDEEQGDADAGKDQANMRLIRKALDEKFKEIDNFLGRKVMKSLNDLSVETGTRLDSIERGSFDTREAIKRDSLQKFANLKETMQEKNNQMQEAMADQSKKFYDQVQDLRNAFIDAQNQQNVENVKRSG